ncbi:MAG: hypothetical protein FWG34_13100 [Oscillospiraceae bacterium]|nr:hypothetical protein [Oscillospiraceae bacterium]
MIKLIKNLFCAVLMLSLVFSAFSSCASATPEKGEKGENDPADNPEEQTESTTEGKLPFEPTVIDLGGRDFTFCDCGWGAEVNSEQRDVLAAEQNGETINDAVYARNMVIMDMFNCVIAEQKYPGPGEMLSPLQKSIKSGDGQFDAAYLRFASHLNSLATGNLLFDLEKMTNMDLAQPWWDQNCVSMTSIAGKLFAVTGDIEILDKGAINAFVFNKQLQSDYQIEDFYGLVKTGKWTLGKMLEISKQISSDLNGDGKMDENDRYGLFYYRDSLPAFLSGAGEYIARKDENDLPYMSFNNEKVYNALESIYEVIYDENVAFHTMRAFGDAGFIIEGNKMFQNNQGLIRYIRMMEIEGLRSMETDFGILPFPKYDEIQKDYLSLVNSIICPGLAIPATADQDISGAVLEAMAYESRYTLLPAYYDVMLKTKVSRDSDSEEMLTIIFGNTTYDLGGIYAFGGIDSELMYHTMDLKRTMASFYEKNESKAQKDIDKLVNSIFDLD